MKNFNYIGVWLDHQHAHLMEYTFGPAVNKELEPKFSHLVNEQNIHRSDNVMHCQSQLKDTIYYQQIGEVIKPFPHVVLFGPSENKHELYGYLRGSHLFDTIFIEVMKDVNMSEYQQHNLMCDFFKPKSVSKTNKYAIDMHVI